MYLFLAPLFLSYACLLASAFTAAYSQRLGRRGGQLASVVLRDVLGLPLLGLAFAMAARAPAPELIDHNTRMDVAGWTLVAGGAVLIAWAVAALRWRAAAPALKDALAREGPYAYVRHPLYDGVFCELAGALLLRPTWPMIVSCVLTACCLLLQAHAEERDLVQRIPGYREYTTQVPRFFPRKQK